MTDMDLLAQYRNGSQQAFTELVHRHAAWVYSVARRRVRDGHLAEDVAQAVFILLAQKAWKIRPAARLQPWLLKVTCYVSNHALRAESRRRRHELQAPPPAQSAPPAAGELTDLLDQSLRNLGRQDQQALLLRFYRQMSLADVGREMNLTEEAARKRVARAILRLRKALAFQGFSLAPALFPQWLDSHAVAPLPAHLTAAASSAALAGSSGAGPSWAFAQAARGRSRAGHARVFRPGASLLLLAVCPYEYASSSRLAPGRNPLRLAARDFCHGLQGVNRMFMWTKIRVAALVCVLVILPGILALTHFYKSADAQSDGAPTNPAGEQLPPAMQADVGNEIESHHVVLALSDDGRHIWGYSAQSGQWTQPTMVTPATKKIVPSVADDVAVFCAGDRVYGYGAIAGRWDSFQLPPGVTVEPSVSSDRAMVHYGSHFWMFSAQTGRWQGIDTNATP